MENLSTAIFTYINLYTDKSVRQRGMQYFMNNHIISHTIDSQKGEASYLVQGSEETYRVLIYNFKNSISSSCTCPYNYGGICKHQTAALYHLERFLKGGTTVNFAPKMTVVKRNTSEPFYINYKSLQKSDFYNYIPSSHSYYSLEITTGLTFPSERKIELIVKNYYRQNIVTLQLHETLGMGFTCNCNNRITKLCEHESAVLNEIAIKNKPDDFLQQLEPEYHENKKKEILKEFGLPDTTPFEDFFKLDMSLRGTIVTPVKKGIGLQRIKSFRKPTEDLVISKFKELSTQPGLNLPAEAGSTKENSELRKIGYVLIPGGEDNSFPSYTKIIEPQLIPICGKPGKEGKGFSAHIKPLDRMDYGTSVNITDADKTLISLASTLTKENAELHSKISGLRGINSDSEKEKFYYEQLSQIVPLLEKEPFVYLMTTGYRADYNLRKSDLFEIKVSSVPVRLSFLLQEKDGMIVLQARFSTGDIETNIESTEPRQMRSTLFSVVNGILHLNYSPEEAHFISLFKSNPLTKVVISEWDVFFEDVVKPIAQKFPLTMKKIQGVKTNSVKMKAVEKRIYISETGNFILFKPQVMYDNQKAVEILGNAGIIEKQGDTITNYERDTAYEGELLNSIKTLHPKFAGQFRSDFFHLHAEEMLNDNWFFNAYEKLKSENINVFGYEQLKSFRYSPFKAKVSVQLKSGVDWFDVYVTVSFGDNNVSLADIQKALLKNEKYIKLTDGTTGILPEEWFNKFKKYFDHGELNGEKVQISKLRFSLIDELFENIDDKVILKELAEKKQKIQSFKDIKTVKIPAGITADLRDYQKEGLKWMNFLDEFKWGGILADDMGLGKTLQTLAFLLHVSGKSKKANLVVLPTSLIFNWENEIKKFAPGLKALFHHGNDRIKDHSSFGDYDLVITSYGLLARDIEVFSSYKFNYIILDESQAIKNPLSQRYKAACLLRGNNRLALTGTPIENNTFDLFAQLSFLNPGFLGSASSFKTKYSIPIDRDRDELRSRELQKLINPFVLRRTKQQVEKDLPEKTEDILYCTMEEEQQKVYDAFRNKYRNYLMNKIEEGGLAKSKIYVLEGLLKLRQICDSPEILSDKEHYSSESIKIKELLRHIQDKTGKHKLLIFSQFVKMLQLIKKQLEESGIKHEYFDGQSSLNERQESVTSFQNDESCRVFLISLKAGGVGINLTAADYVYIVDPWWNPAVENQAIDRCHRIGQDKKVIAYRMICKNTVEEKILNFQAKKKQIASDIIQTDESFIKSITKSDIEDLLG